MTQIEYEEAYKEALLSIPNASIGEPYELGETRFVVINGEHCVDDVVFNLA